MADNPYSKLLGALIRATKPSEVAEILAEIGDHNQLAEGEPFGEHNFRWRYYGDSNSNISSINLGSQPGRSLIERVTNAIDAVLEKAEALDPEPPPNSPMEAAQRWFGRPPSTSDSGLFSWSDFEEEGFDRLIHVVLNRGDERPHPTIDVIDAGIGIPPDEFANTILSLQQGNKITKRYLAGAFGQGGAATLSFCSYVLVLSRHLDDPAITGFTLIKLLPLGELYKEDAYVYLTVEDEDGNLTVPSCRIKNPINLYPHRDVHPALKELDTGTVVRHYGYRLDGLHQTFTSGTNNLQHFMNYMMMDPLLPFRVVDLSRRGITDELVVGSRNRLMSYIGQREPVPEVDDSATVLRHYARRELINPPGEDNPSIGFEYWVVLNKRPLPDGQMVTRSRSHALFIDPLYPIVGTLNGQNQGSLTSRIIRDLELSMISRHLIIHIDATQASKRVRANLFSSTREGFREDVVLKELTKILVSRMATDPVLYQIERELVDELTQPEANESDMFVKKEITKLLRNIGFSLRNLPGLRYIAPVVPPPEQPAGHTQVFTATATSTPPPDSAPTLPYPNVTQLKIVKPVETERLVVHQDNNQILQVETDADDTFDNAEDLDLRIDPPTLEVASRVKLRDGRMYWRLRPTKDATPGDTGTVEVVLTKPTGAQLVARESFEIQPPRPPSPEQQRARQGVPDFRIVQVDPVAHPAIFQTVWPDLEREKSTRVAYRAVNVGGEIRIYYSTAFTPYRKQFERAKKHASLAERFRRNYEIWIGYHAILQFQQQSELMSITDAAVDDLSKIRDHERSVVAEIQAKQAMRTAMLQHEAEVMRKQEDSRAS